MRVAICDDNRQDIEKIRRYALRMIDYAVEYEFYDSPKELLKTCAGQEHGPDMYILDIEMPGMDGLETAREIRTRDSKALMCIIFTIIVMNYILFLMIENYTAMEEKQHEEEMMQSEITYCNEYYRDVEQYQEQIQDIKHDMKNRLIALLDAAEQRGSGSIKDKLQEMLGDIRLAEEIIYSANPVLNSILKVKSAKAREKGIRMEINVLIPQKISIEIGDMGVLYGNLLDNAIEACSSVDQEKRIIKVETKYQEGKLLLKIVNSKMPIVNPKLATSKKDKRKHGRGIRSVRKVAEKYGGNLLLNDEGENFEAVLFCSCEIKK